MIWNNFVNRLAVASRRRALATAVVYGLSLSVRFTSAAGEEVEIPPPFAQRTMPRALLPYQESTLSIIFRPEWPSVRQTAGRACEPSLPMLMQGGLGP